MSFQVGDKVVCNCPGNWEKIIDEQILTVVPNDKGLTFEGQEGKICLKFLEDWPKDFSLVEEENEAKSMKIRITTSEFSYMGLHYGAVIENAVLEFPPHVPARVEFKHNGKCWCLSSDNYEIVADKSAPAEEEAAHKPAKKEQSALDIQVGGEHYKSKGIQPIEYAHANNLGFMEANIVKYVSRHQDKNGADDIRKAIHYCKFILELKYGIKE